MVLPARSLFNERSSYGRKSRIIDWTGASMSESKRLLPGRPSLEQLQRQAKELLRDMRGGESTSPPTLADAQFALAREYGFESWARLKRYVESVTDPAMAQFEGLAKRLADAYTSADLNAIREINWTYGTSFIWY